MVDRHLPRRAPSIPLPMLPTRPGPYLLLLLAFVTFTEVEAGPYFRTGKIYFSRRSYAKALEYFQKETAAAPGNGDAFFYIGYIHEREGRSLEAVRNFQRAVELHMDRDLKLKAFWKIVLHYKYQGDWTNVAFYCRKFLAFRNLEAIRKMLEEAELHYSPDEKRITDLLLRAEGLLSAGKAAEAIPVLEQVTLAFPDHRRALWNLSQAHIKLGSYSRAIPPLERLVQANDAIWQYHYRLGLCRFRVGRPETALIAFEKARSLNEDGSAETRHFIHLRIGDSHLVLDHIPEARKAYELAAHAQASQDAKSRLAYVAWRRGAHAEALKMVAGASGRKSDIGALVRLLDSLHRKDARRATGLEERLHRAETLGEWLPPGTAVARVVLMDLLAARGRDWKTVIKLAERSRVEVATAEAGVLGREKGALKVLYRQRYGQALIETGRAAEALALLATEASPESQYQWARASAATAADTQAIEALRRILAIKPDWLRRARADVHFKGVAGRNEAMRELLLAGGEKSQ